MPRYPSAPWAVGELGGGEAIFRLKIVCRPSFVELPGQLRFFVKTKALQDIDHACNIIKLGNYDHQELERFMVKMLRRSRGDKEVYDKALQLQELYLAMNAQKSFGPKIP